jgi:acetoin utilization deacetylase AcuC-like enzyme
LLRASLLKEGILLESQLQPSPFADLADIYAVHAASYVDSVLEGTLGPKEQKQIGLPWSPQLARRTLATMGGAVEAARAALTLGFSAQLAGGTHHAHGNFGSGYCVFNDFAIVALKALREGWVDRIAIIDLDVHQGDGNAALLGTRSDVFILDLYCEKNFPFRKVLPHLPAAMEPGISDRAYLSRLSGLLPAVLDFRPGLVLYQAGVDPLSHDLLGHLDLNYDGLAMRDRLVMETCKRAGIALSLAIGGGYANPISLSVQAYVNTFRTAKEVYGF